MNTAWTAAVRRDGYARLPRVVDADGVQRWLSLFAAGVAGAGERDVLRHCPGARAELDRSPLPQLAALLLGPAAQPVQAILFDKTPAANWMVAAHQDLAMPFAERREVAGFTGWSEKDGVAHALPPDQLLARMLALRLCLDDCPAENGALAVVAGSHAQGRWTEAQLQAVPRAAFTVCAAAAGDVLAMRPLLVHRSSRAEAAGHRRVLHVVFAAGAPGGGLRWREQRPG